MIFKKIIFAFLVFYLNVASALSITLVDLLDEAVSVGTKTAVMGVITEWKDKDQALSRFALYFHESKSGMIPDAVSAYEALIARARKADFSEFDQMSKAYREAPFMVGNLSGSDRAKEALGWMNMMDTLSGEDVWKLSNFLRDIQSINNKEKSADIVKLKNKAKDMGSPSAIDWAREAEEDEGVVAEE
ncbi:MAG: hypothetical protein K2Q34_02320 [Alphaproteobacteria bacterium]|nr:hypothetical protein [Alphaproteobacteria bacterium]